MEDRLKNSRELVEELRQEWKAMWWRRIDDKVRAESIADKTYKRLFVDRGTILMATRKYKPPEFDEILARYLSPTEMERANPNPIRGGVRKFIREYITAQNSPRSKRIKEMSKKQKKVKKAQQLKKGGRGWLHLSECSSS